MASLRRFLRLVRARLYQVLVHRDSCSLRVVRPDGLIDPPVRFRGVAQIARERAFGRSPPPLVVKSGYHLDQRGNDRIPRRRRDGAMEVDVVHQEDLR